MSFADWIAGGVALDGRDDLREGHAKMTDKLIGKTQKVNDKVLIIWAFTYYDIPLGCWKDASQT